MPEVAISNPGSFTEGIPYVVQARVVDKEQAILQGSEITATYILNAYDITTRGVPTLVHNETSGNLVLQNVAVTNGWDKDETGWNIELSIAPGALDTPAVGGKSYKFELTLTVTATSEVIAVDFRMGCLGRAGT